jgi:biotin transport system substrate-specific component
MNNSKILKICLVALFAALISCGAFVSLPLPGGVPISIQNLFAILGGMTLGPFYGALAVALYLLAGAIGLPVFAGVAGGFVRFAGPSGGYLWGYLLGAAVAGLIAGKFVQRGGGSGGTAVSKARIILAALAGFAVVYIPGIIQLKIVLHLSWPAAFTAGFVPFVPGDIAKVVIVSLISPRLRRVVRRG